MQCASRATLHVGWLDVLHDHWILTAKGHTHGRSHLSLVTVHNCLFQIIKLIYEKYIDLPDLETAHA